MILSCKLGTHLPQMYGDFTPCGAFSLKNGSIIRSKAKAQCEKRQSSSV